MLVLCGYLWQLCKAHMVQMPFALAALIPNCMLAGPVFKEGGFLCCKATRQFSDPIFLLPAFFCLEPSLSLICSL